MLLLWALLACDVPTSAPAEPAAPVAPGVAGAAPVATAAGRYRVAWSADPAPIPFNTLFAIRTVLTDPSGAPVPDGVVLVDATMPQHGHGMPTHPVPDPGSCPAGVVGPADGCVHPGGVYRTEGMKFHMPGEWVLHFQVDGPAGPDALDVHYAL